jgi:hypothetical protein
VMMRVRVVRVHVVQIGQFTCKESTEMLWFGLLVLMYLPQSTRTLMQYQKRR